MKSRVSDRLLLVIVSVICVVGILMVYNSSVAIAQRDFSDQYYFAKEQLKWLLVGSIGLIIAAKIDYTRWYQWSLPLLLGTIVLLLAVFVPGIGVGAQGAHRWINLGFTTLQPAELAKFSIIIYLSAWLSKPEKGRFGAFALLMAMVVGLVVIEPDLGTAVVILAVSVLMYYYSGAPIAHFLVMIPVLVAGGGVLAIVAPYRFARLTTFFNPQADPLGASYQIRQILLALGSGGLFGVGIGKSRQKYEYLPEANTDSIFAIIGEELGFVGSVVIIGLLLMLIWRGFRIAKYAPDSFGRLLALGIASWIAVQAGINLSAMVALVPLTGIPLPFISYGGSSLIILLVSVGILLNISKHS
ncbi:cell division protein FtsW [Candidatus Gottesmanbacteria bacterium RIFCSPHIGHO2_01_FULL_46_14]|uniref:Probable peptidoglycan glycosyltransferase FtsW n=2 Tax=Candidatus Gottesmaniibacteriota TaxID=1752720 RepID=A0A1F5ZRA1_9BACT|nr:MAG: cell division protein FtsW [Candidatus Gottesmanbacteria bacterium RIFCSPHIGHO2_01_FULL_46_14]OGG29257.1 MAG: cell division protein FtsW [Candidatus Gottesmanbacteria bacterium RIFCSPLOWO2_01_FULL_46_21]